MDAVAEQAPNAVRLVSELEERRAELRRIIELELGHRPRSPAGAEYAQGQPRDWQQVERDAEVQEIARMFNALDKSYNTVIHRIEKASSAEVVQRTKRVRWMAILYAIVLSLLIGVLSGFLVAKAAYGITPAQVVADISDWMSGDLSGEGKTMLAAASPGVKTGPVAMALPAPGMGQAAPEARVAGPPDAASRAPVPATILALADANAQPPQNVTVQPVSVPLPMPRPEPMHQTAVAVAPTTTKGAQTPSAQVTLKSPGTQKSGANEEEQLFAIYDAANKRSEVAQTKAKPNNSRGPTAKAMPITPERGLVANTQGPDTSAPPQRTETVAVAAGPRRARYGDGGVVTLLPNAVVVFDPVKKTQVLVKTGQKLFDGTTITSVDPKSGLVGTDKGDVVFD